MIDTNSIITKIIRRLVLLFSRFYSDRKFLEALFPLRVGYKLNLDNPKTFNEKLQWLKLYDRKPKYTQMVDKVEAKKYVANIIGEEYIIPTLAVYDRVEDIDFDALPNQFVLKCTHDSGGVVICHDKSKFDKKVALKKLAKALKVNYYYRNREWPYKNVRPRIVAEQYITDGYEWGLRDYKFYCFKGYPKVMFIGKDRQKEPKFNFYDMEFNKLPFMRGYPNFNEEIEKPEGWDEMVKMAGKLSKDIPQLRVDFYNVNGKIFFGELTFFPGSGMVPFNPIEWDYKLGEMISLALK